MDSFFETIPFLKLFLFFFKLKNLPYNFIFPFVSPKLFLAWHLKMTKYVNNLKGKNYCKAYFNFIMYFFILMRKFFTGCHKKGDLVESLLFNEIYNFLKLFIFSS